MPTTIIITIAVAASFILLIVFNHYKMKKKPEVKTSDKILTLNNKTLSNATRKGTVLVDFWAPWCAPCKMIAPILNDVAEEMDGELKIGKVNIDHNQPLAKKFKVRNIPTMLVFKDGVEVERIIGVKSKKALLKQLAQFTA